MKRYKQEGVKRREGGGWERGREGLWEIKERQGRDGIGNEAEKAKVKQDRK